MKQGLMIYDTTLRDGAQMQGIQFSLNDKLAIARWLDNFGIDYIEAGWPGANPVDDQLYRELKKEPLKKAKLVAFGSTCKPHSKAEEDPQLQRLLTADTPVVTLVAKFSKFHIEQILQTSIEENCRMISDSVACCRAMGREVWVDAEHFFDGFKACRETTLACVLAAEKAGANGLVCCDTNGGNLPHEITSMIEELKKHTSLPLGIHAHNDGELAVANSLSAYHAGVAMIQGTINGYGERCGNANLISVIANLQLKMAIPLLPAAKLRQLTELSRNVAARANKNADSFAPFVGHSAFAHKAGLHASAVAKFHESYEHICPESVGNHRQVLISGQAGRSNLKSRFADQINDYSQALALVKERENQGFQFEQGDASLDLMLRRLQVDYQPPFALQELVVHSLSRCRGEGLHQASVKLEVQGQSLWAAAEGQGPVDAIDKAMRDALSRFWPEISASKLTDYKVRILDPEAATGATTHVWLEAAFADQVWNTIGCSRSIIEASEQALSDAFEYFIVKQLYAVNPTKIGASNGNQPSRAYLV